MKLNEVFNALQYGELYNVALTGDIDEPSGIAQTDWPILITHINMALTDMHTKLNLKEKELTIQQYESIVFYKLDPAYAVSNTTSTEPIKYIEDTVESPFLDDILRINSVYDEAGCELPINDEHREDSLFLPEFDIIQFPFPADENTVFVLYRANHPWIDPNTLDPTTVEVDIPSYCLEPLLAYVASRVHSSRTSQEAQGLAVNLLAKYDLLLNNLKKYNTLHNDPSLTNVKLGVNGWV